MGRSPLKDKPLRTAGQSVREHRFDFAYDKVFGPFLMAMLMAYVAGMDWLRYFFPQASSPWLTTAIALAAALYSLWCWQRHWPKVRALRLAEEGEKAVGQLLETLRTSGYMVFHDLVGNEFNVDHALIGPGGIFTVETKTYSKPKEGKATVSFDGETLRVAGFEPDRDPVIQAKAQASWLRSLLAESTGKDFAVRPVVALPGWFVENTRDSFKHLWVLEPKALLKFIANEKPQLAPEDVALASSHLARFIRAEEQRRAMAQ